MKRVIIILMMLISFTAFANEADQTAAKEVVRSLSPWEEVLKPYLIDMLDMAKQGKEFIVREAPVVIQQYIYFTATQYWFYVLIGFLIATVVKSYAINQFTVKSKTKPETKKRGEEYIYKSHNRWLRVDNVNESTATVEQIVYPVFKWFFLIIGIIVMLTNILTAIKITFFPKLYLVEQFLYLIK